jgi:hypothetical protein
MKTAVLKIILSQKGPKDLDIFWQKNIKGKRLRLRLSLVLWGVVL